MNSAISHVITLLTLHAGLSEIQAKHLLEMAARLDISQDDKDMLKTMSSIDADTAAALHRSIEILDELSRESLEEERI
jgi:hypothetical protein